MKYRIIIAAAAAFVLSCLPAPGRQLSFAWDYPSGALSEIERFEIWRLDPITTLWVKLAETAPPAPGAVAPTAITVPDFPDAPTTLACIAVSRLGLPSAPSNQLEVPAGTTAAPSGFRIRVTVEIETP